MSPYFPLGSTTTKALLIHDDKGKPHFADALDVPTTVEKPNEDVKIGYLMLSRGYKLRPVKIYLVQGLLG